jgi:hypothetical protein
VHLQEELGSSFLQVWRLVTNFLVLGPLNFNFLMHIIWVLQFGCPLESHSFQFQPADYLWFLIVSGSSLVGASYFTRFPLNGMPLIMAIVYMWSRNFPDRQVRGGIHACCPSSSC